jgi:dTDP-4-amino-4,6-dideoxygalactose transaminase
MSSKLDSIVFNRPSFIGAENRYVEDALLQGHISGDGRYSKLCHSLLEETLGVPKALLTTSCTHALEMAALLLDCAPGDEVIVPSFTFVSTANAFALRGARPVFVDIRPDTLNIDERLIEGAITSRTKAIAIVHYAGVACEMDSIMKSSAKHGIAVVEDNAHGLYARYNGKYLGTFGCAATQSFHETKNFTCGEGGALLVNDPAMIDRAEVIREKGTNRNRFFRGEIDKYTWVDLGSSYLPSDILAAILYAQLECRESIQSSRRRIWEFYHESLAAWAVANGVTQPFVPPSCEQSHHMYYLIMPSLEARQSLIQHLRGQGIHAVFHYMPLHLSEVGRNFGGRPGDCPVTEDVSDRLVRLPFYNTLSRSEQERVIESVLAFPVNEFQVSA